MCRSRRELSNEYLLAKFGFDTAENEPCEVRKFELSEMLNLNFEISKLLFATQITFNVWPRQPPDQLEDVVVSTAESRR